MKGKFGLTAGILALVGLVGGTLLLTGIVTGYGTGDVGGKAAIGENIVKTAMPATLQEPGDGCTHGASCEGLAGTKCGSNGAASKDGKSACSMHAGEKACGGCEGSATTKDDGKCPK